MAKQKIEIEVEVADGWEAVAVQLTPDTYKIDVKEWVWPAWILGNWIAMDACGEWSVFENEPEIEDDSDDGYWFAAGRFAELRGLVDVGSKCTDWRQSKRRRPEL